MQDNPSRVAQERSSLNNSASKSSLPNTNFEDCEIGMKNPEPKGLYRRQSSAGEIETENYSGGKPRKPNIQRMLLNSVTASFKKGARMIGIRGANIRRKHNRGYSHSGSQNYGSVLSSNVFVPNTMNKNDLSESQTRYSSDKTIMRDNFTRRDELSPLFPDDERLPNDSFRIDEDESIDHSVILAMERFLRYLLLAGGIYWLGLHRKIFSSHVLDRAGELVFVAWATCVIIIVITKLAKKRARSTDRANSALAPAYSYEYQVSPTETLPQNKEQQHAGIDAAHPKHGKEHEVYDGLDLARDLDETGTGDRSFSQTSLHHPELVDNLQLIDCTTFKRVMPNAGPVPIDNDYMYGVMVPMFRTSDADRVENPSDNFNPSHRAVSNYLRPKQRRFELQFQVKFKRIPDGAMFFAMRLSDSIKLGLVQRAFVGATLNFIKKKNSNGFHFNIDGPQGYSEEDVAAGKYEVPQLSFTVESCMDRIVITKPGGSPPALGGDIYEDPESIKKRKKGLTVIDYNTEDTFTFSLWSAYPDFITWKVINLPAIRPFSFAAVFGDQPITFVWYALKASDGNHYERDIIPFMAVEFNHKTIKKGPAFERWSENNVAEDEEFIADTNDLSSIDDSLHAAEQLEDMDQEFKYIKSGSPIILHETETERSDIFLADGGGYATLQNHNGCILVLMKVFKEQLDKKKILNHVIKSGDVVRIKMIYPENRGEPNNERYLSVTRGSWLRWARRTNTAFEIICDESAQFDTDEIRGLKFGESFQLKLRASTQYLVGASDIGLVSIGGRAVGLYRNYGDNEDDRAYISDNDTGDTQKAKKTELKPLQLCATNVPALTVGSGSDNFVSKSTIHVDIPAWVEMMDRSKRIKQRIYVVRVSDKRKSVDDSTYVRLRSGKSILPLLLPSMKLAQNGSNGRSDLAPDDLGDPAVLRLIQNENDDIDDDRDQKSDDDRSVSSSDDDLPATGDALKTMFSTESIVEEHDDNLGLPPTDSSPRRRSWISASTSNQGRAAKTAGTFKLSASSINKTKPSLKIDGTLKFKLNNQDHSTDDRFPRAGRLSSANHSCMVLSRWFDRVSGIQSDRNELVENVQQLLQYPSKLDSWFLRGGCTELGIVPLLNESGPFISQHVIARCIYESHWREEVALFYKSYVTFYASLSKKPCLSIAFNEIDAIRTIRTESDFHPIPGFPTLCLDTACRCHYFSFADMAALDAFANALREQIAAIAQTQRKVDNEISNAFLLQKIQQMSDSSVTSDEYKKWDKVISGNKARNRIVLNNRRMAFDVADFIPQDGFSLEHIVGAFVQNLLSRALSFTLNELEESPESFINFLDDTSRLRKIPLSELDLSGKESFCIFVNLYHCLFQHAMLLSPFPLNKKNLHKFMRTICYEVGGDVFSLSELQTYVIRGKLTKCFYVKPPSPYAVASRRSQPYQRYALGYADARVNFVLQCADTSQPRATPVLIPDSLDDQLTLCAKVYLSTQLFVDKARNTITLPKVCDIYRNDFGELGNPTSCAVYCAKYLEPESKAMLMQMVKNSSSPGTMIFFKYRQVSGKFHECLCSM